MSAPLHWWVLSLAVSCFYALLASTLYPRWLGIRRLQHWPSWVKTGIYILYMPLLLALGAVGFSDWLTGQSVAYWSKVLSDFGKIMAIVLSLQALCFLFHGRVYGTFLLLMVSTMSLQLWLYYQALGIDFRNLGLIYAITVFMVVAGLRLFLHRPETEVRIMLARTLAILVLAMQWAFTANFISADPVQSGFAWVTLQTTLVPCGLMMLLVAIGYGWQGRTAFAGRLSGG
ncbi:MAG: hypothetical protein OXD01_01775 [Gammaproteobacteria bacterium]|nr:hypothetical protein [Gammaproteobacteria bacterium]